MGFCKCTPCVPAATDPFLVDDVEHDARTMKRMHGQSPVGLSRTKRPKMANSSSQEPAGDDVGTRNEETDKGEGRRVASGDKEAENDGDSEEELWKNFGKWLWTNQSDRRLRSPKLETPTPSQFEPGIQEQLSCHRANDGGEQEDERPCCVPEDDIGNKNLGDQSEEGRKPVSNENEKNGGPAPDMEEKEEEKECCKEDEDGERKDIREDTVDKRDDDVEDTEHVKLTTLEESHDLVSGETSVDEEDEELWKHFCE
jgi:hypothetical protein